MKKLKLVGTVKINGRHFDPEIVAILNAARSTAPDLQDDTVWVTSANDLKHKENSKHYSNDAFDIRTRNVVNGKTDVQRWVAKMRGALGLDYDIILEVDHIHAEYDPKSPRVIV